QRNFGPYADPARAFRAEWCRAGRRRAGCGGGQGGSISVSFGHERNGAKASLAHFLLSEAECWNQANKSARQQHRRGQDQEFSQFHPPKRLSAGSIIWRCGAVLASANAYSRLWSINRRDK